MTSNTPRPKLSVVRVAVAIAACVAATAAGLAVAAKPGGGGGGTTWTVRLQLIADSIGMGYNANCTGNTTFLDLLCYSGGDQPENSYFDGTSAAVLSLADRFIAAGASTTYSKAAAQSGSEMVGGSNNFAKQAAAVVAAAGRKPVQVKVELGGNDICNRTSTLQMYTDDTWRAAVRAGLDTLSNRLPDGSSVLLIGVPRVQDLYAAGVAKSAGSSRVDCESFWSTYDVCQIATRNALYGNESLRCACPRSRNARPATTRSSSRRRSATTGSPRRPASRWSPKPAARSVPARPRSATIPSPRTRSTAATASTRACSGRTRCRPWCGATTRTA